MGGERRRAKKLLKDRRSPRERGRTGTGAIRTTHVGFIERIPSTGIHLAAYCAAWNSATVSVALLASASASSLRSLPIAPNADWTFETFDFSYGLLAWLPSFLSSALNVSLSKSSFLSILPYLATVGMTLIVAPTAAKLEAGGMTRTNVRKLSQTLCFTGGAVCLSAVAFVVNSTPPEAVTQTTVITIMTLLSIGFGLGAWVRTGLFCGHQDISPKYASIMLGTTNTLAAVASTLSTFFTGYFFSITGGNWALSLFLPIAFFQVVSTLIFMMWDSTPVDFDAIQAEGKLKAA